MVLSMDATTGLCEGGASRASDTTAAEAAAAAVTAAAAAGSAPHAWFGGVERRRGLRIRQSRPVKVFEPTAGRYVGGQTADVSTTGLRLELPLSVAVRPGKVLAIHVGLSERGEALANRRSMIPARVVWVDRSADLPRGRMALGVEFLAGISVLAGAA